MRRLLIAALLLMMVVPVAEARRKKPKAGEIVEKVYTDAKHGFQFTIHENWGAKVRKDESEVRVVLTQKSYAIPPDYIDAPDYTQVPKVSLYVDTSSVNIHAFVDSLTSYSYKSDQKKQMLKEFDFLNEQEIIPKGRSRVGFDGESGLLWKGQSKYIKEVSTSASSVGGKRVYGSYGGAIAITRKGNLMIVFHVICEWSFYESIMSEVREMLSTFTWEAASPETIEDEG